MIFSTLKISVVASLLLLAKSSLAQSLPESITAATATVAVGPLTTLSCYSDPGSLKSEGSLQYQASGPCQRICTVLKKPVMATTQGSFCYCGDALPAPAYKAANSSCSSPCSGYDLQMCGGIDFWTFYLSGVDKPISIDPNPSSSSSANPTSSSTNSRTSSPAVTQVTQTIVATTAASAASGSGTSKVGVAVGVIVGLIGIASIIGGVVLYLKQRRRKAIEEEHRNAAVSAFVGGKVERSQTDQRLDIQQTNKFRRQSIGSIADENDFSRRILQVRNPDSNRSSMLSHV